MNTNAATSISPPHGNIRWDSPLIVAGLVVLTLFWAGLLLNSASEWNRVLAIAGASQLICVVLASHELRRSPFAPFVWFSAMYFLLPVMAAYMVIAEFGDIYHNNVAFKSNRIHLMELALIVALLGYLMYWLGDVSCGKAREARKSFKDDLLLDRSLLNVVVVACYAIGVFNFGLNAWLYDPANLASLLMDYGARDHRLDQVPSYFTTIGYNFLVVALVLHLYIRAKFFDHVGRAFFILSAASAIIMLSTGRVWYTFSVGLALFACWSLCFTDRRISRVLLGVSLIIGLVVVGFVLRVVSNLLYVEGPGGELSWIEIGLSVGGDLSYLILGRSNVPSLPILMEVIDHYGRTVPFLKGESLFYWTSYFLPGDGVHFLGHEIKDQFYSGRPGGFPPTIFGELYANGGPVFVALGCFLLGASLKLAYLVAIRSGSFLALFVYAAFLFRFVFMLPKLELAALGSAIWLVAPIVLMWFGLRVLSEVRSPESGVRP